MKQPKYILLSILPLYLLFFIQGFYVVIYKENPIARVIAVISMIIFTIMLTLLVSRVLDASKQNKNGKIR
ncbi:hypothetical protein MUA77_09795 [Mammaliicoccus sciuri]|uniref:hypothetical protein n=1 Tax=Mammaliicoccus sciuri TaxID=1296 RepID=UPI0021CE6866|nr:hypothetical protein [Mammaliicoccus sciuri]UXU83102.1 hypothetical protein MUA77_09795 [Mammaliicoccus sciuri]UXU92948.1 hypothetical protein MUA42_09805 [Mammaliicoccus sciuri]UXV14850.1 hypothetical protein MUA89_09810 [Mammaliicoccus sciuri]UXV23162.1 hypothetical protein MUA49_09805 [Mammaliicoccus sciuri]UXV25892.1 hypothetical protein MUA96_09800 [Mammaliicoccus sciuri]